MKYIMTSIGNAITHISKESENGGEATGILETFIPDGEQMTLKEGKAWIEANNKRMTAICNFLNEKQF